MDVSELRNAVKEFLLVTTPITDHISHLEWKESDGMVPVIFRAVLKRQCESLSSIVEMSGTEKGYSAVSLLRPACEELIWIRYLKHIGLKDANELLRLMAVTEVGKTLGAQLEFVGPETMKSLGFTPTFLSDQSASVLEAEKRLRVLDKRLKWGVKKKGQIPSVFFLAKATNNLELYKFLYHSTSKFVHFSVHELMRRVWGRPGALSISSDTYAKYWSAFSLRWGLHLYLETLVEALDWIEPEAGPDLSEARLMETAEVIRKFGMVPIITAEELRWPFHSEA
jgi:hypothetical protein